MKRALLREPLVHYLALGIVLFAGYALITGGENSGSEQIIQVTETEIQWLAETHQSRWQRPPTDQELQGLVETYVREEVLYREALAVGLDRDDGVVRRRLVQKLEFITEDLASQVPPSEIQLQTFFNENLDSYRIPEYRSFQHVFLDLGRRGAGVDADAKRILDRLRTTSPSLEEAVMMGDGLMLENEFRDLSELGVARSFGARFASSLFQVEPGGWQGPILSEFGLHLVRVVDFVQGRVPDLTEVRDEVLRDYGVDAQRRAKQALYESLRAKYQIEVDSEAISSLSMQPRGERGGS